MEDIKQPPPPHFLVVAYPAQSHLNPALQLAYRLIHSGATVTLATTISASKRIEKATNNTSATTSLPSGLRFATYSDGFDQGYQSTGHTNDDGPAYLASIKQHGSETLSNLIKQTEQTENQGFDCVIYTIILTWVAQVARQHQLPSTLLWIQPAAMFDICYSYFHGLGDAIQDTWRKRNTSTSSVKIPGIPALLEASDLPTYLSPVLSRHAFLLLSFVEQFAELDDYQTQENYQHHQHVNILFNTFDALEVESLKAIPSKFKVRTVGPLLPITVLQHNKVDVDDESGFRVDMFRKSDEDDYFKWLDSMEDSSVVYVSFGSISVLSATQIEELAAGLMDCGRPFLWVIRPSNKDDNNSTDDKVKQEEEDQTTSHDQQIMMKKMMNWLKQEETEKNKRGMVVPWCSQVQVLSHKAVGCFVTHCGWNSSLESLACGVRVVGVPQWADQMTNVKLLEDVWKVGVRARPKTNEEEEGGLVVDKEEIRRCVEQVMASDEMRRNARRWKELAVEASTQGGSSHMNLREFVDQVIQRRNRHQILSSH